MTATYGTISTVPYSGRVNTTITAPASITNGDMLLLLFFYGSGSMPADCTLPAGFTAIGTQQSGTDAGFSYKYIQAYKIAAGESGDYTVTHGSYNTAAAIVRVDGANVLSIDVQSQNTSVANGPTTTALSVTTTAADDLLFFVGLNWDAAALTPPTGMTSRLTTTIVDIATQALSATGATGDRTQTHNTNIWFGNLIAIKDTATPTSGKVSVKHAGTWKEPTKIHVKHAGTWKEPTGVHVKQAGTWVKVYPSVAPTFMGAAIDLDFQAAKYWFNGALRTTAEFGAYTLGTGGTVDATNGFTPGTGTVDVWVPLTGMGTIGPVSMAIAFKNNTRNSSVARSLLSINTTTTTTGQHYVQNALTAGPPGNVMGVLTSGQATILTGNTPFLNTRYGLASSHNTNDFRAATNGTPLPVDTVGTIQTTHNRLYVGAYPPGTNTANVSNILRVLAWPGTKTQQELNDISRAMRDGVESTPPASSANLIANGSMASPGTADASSGSSATPFFFADNFSFYENTTAAGTIARVTQTSPFGSTKRGRFTVTTAAATMSGSVFHCFEMTVDGAAAAALQWGTGSAKNAIFRFGWRQNSGTVRQGLVAFMNSALNRTFSSMYVPTELATDAYFEIFVPGDTAGTWLTGAGQVGVKIRIGNCGSGLYDNSWVWHADNLWGNSGGSTSTLNTVNQAYDLFDVGLYVDNGRGYAPAWAG